MTQKNDVSPFIAILLIIGTGLVFLALKHFHYLEDNWNTIVWTLENSQNFLLVLGTSLVINFFVLMTVAERMLGFKKQGSRLRSIKKDKESSKGILLKLSFSLVTTFIFNNDMALFGIKNGKLLKNIMSHEFYIMTLQFSELSLCLTLFIVFYGLSLVAELCFRPFFRSSKWLPLFPMRKNMVTLGSAGEEKSDIDKIEKPTWIRINEKALCGNILITGSIGAGKSQGTMFTYANQLFEQFTASPATLVLDPKGSFLCKIVEMLKLNGLEEKMVYLGDGDVFRGPENEIKMTKEEKKIRR